MSSEQRDGQSPTYGGLITIWPEWVEADLLAEKWDVQGTGQAGKSAKDPKVKGTYFEDPEGKTRLPQSLLLVLKEWKRPQEILGENLCVVRNTNRINLKEPNQHLMHSEFLRHFISYVMIIWYSMQRRKLEKKPKGSTVPTPSPVTAFQSEPLKRSAGTNKESKHGVSSKDNTNSKTSQELPHRALCFEDPMIDWAPWNLIYAGPPAVPKAASKGEPPDPPVVTNLPQYNANGKYAVRLFWMGSWRKIVVDDLVPVDMQNRSLLPLCAEKAEIWPIILTKAVLKIVSLDYVSGFPNSELGDPGFILHTLTGWVPYVIYLDQPKWTRKSIWNKLQGIVPLNKKQPPGDVLSALAINWDIRTKSAFRRWRMENDPSILSRIEMIRTERLQMAHHPTSATPQSPVASGASTAGGMLTPKAVARGASARLSNAVPRKIEISTPSPLSQLTAVGAVLDPQKIKRVKTPEIMVLASYRSAHHDNGSFDNRSWSRSGPLYENGFLRSESHPLLIRSLKDIFPYRRKQSPVPRFKLYRPIKVKSQHYSQILARAQKAKEHGARYVEFLSLFWREKGRLIHQTETRSSLLLSGGIVQDSDAIRFKPTDGFKNTLPAIPEGALFPLKKIVQPPLEIVVKPPSAQSEPVPEQKSKPGKNTETGKDGKSPPLESLLHPPPPLPPAQSIKELQSFCRLNMGTIGFNQFFESLEVVYVFCKPETFDYQSNYSFFQSNVITDGRPPPNKKKAVEQNMTLGSGGIEGTRGTASKTSPGTVLGRYGKLPVDLPSPFLILDNPYPSNLIFSVSCVSRWFFSPKSETKSPDRLSIVAKTMEELKGNEKPLPIHVTFTKHDWLGECFAPVICSVKTSGTQGCCIHVPPGRHIWRLKVTCPGRKELEPHGYFIRVVSKDPVHLGTEDIILKMSATDSYQYTNLARRALFPILKWWRLNGNPTFTHPPYKEVIAELGLEEDITSKLSSRIFFYAMLRAIYTAIQQYLTDFCNARTVFALRVFFSDVVTTNILSISSNPLAKRDSKGTLATVTSKSEIHSAKPTDNGRKGKFKATEAMPFPAKNNLLVSPLSAERESTARQRTPPTQTRKEMLTREQMSPKHVKAVSLWQLYFISLRLKGVLEARKGGIKKKENVLKVLMDMFEAVVKNEHQFACCFFRVLCRTLPSDWLDLSFVYDQEVRYIYKDITGNCAEIPPNTFKLIFRDTFNVTEPTRIVFRLTINVGPCRLTVVNNDTGNVIPSSFFLTLPYLYTRNESGYTIVAEARSGSVGWRAAPWTLRIIQALDPLKHESSQADSLLVRMSTLIPTTFVTKEISDYFLPEVDSTLIAKAIVRVRNISTITIVFTTSNPDVLFDLTILLKKRLIYRTFGRGIATIPAFTLRSTETVQNEIYHIQANCLEQSWPMSGDDWRFVYFEKNRRTSIDFSGESPIPATVSPSKSSSRDPKKNVKSNKDKEKQEKPDLQDGFENTKPVKGKEKEEPQLDPNRPSWSIKFILDPNDVDFEFKKDTENEDGLRHSLQAAVAADPTIIQRGREYRDEFLRKGYQEGFVPPDSAEYPGWTSGTAEPVWPKPHREYPLSFDLASFTKNPSGDAPQEFDNVFFRKMICSLKEQYDVALAEKQVHIAAEKKTRDAEIHKQNLAIRQLVDVTIAERRMYVEQREQFKRKLEELAGHEDKLLAPLPPEGGKKGKAAKAPKLPKEPKIVMSPKAPKTKK